MALPRKIMTFLAVGAVSAIGFSAYAFTASNTVPNSQAGDGTSTVSGYTVTAVAYGLNGSTPTDIDSVSFTISPAAAGTVKAKMNGTWYNCANAAGSITCATTAPQLTVSPLSSLEALAVQ